MFGINVWYHGPTKVLYTGIYDNILHVGTAEGHQNDAANSRGQYGPQLLGRPSAASSETQTASRGVKDAS